MEKSIRKKATTSSLARRLGWFVLLWCSGVGAVAVVGLVIKLMLGA